jgi:Xaa-Pro aminopeptidase
MNINRAIPSELRYEEESPIVMSKSCKNDVEMAGMIAAHIRDGAAECEFLAWLEEHLASGGSITEYDIDIELTGWRKKAGKFIEPSFATIAGVNENGAIIHYRAAAETAKRLSSGDMLLLDSGGQYLDGTTDVTRTMHYGTPSDYQKEMFTRVLQGHIALDRMIFPTGTPGCLLDTFAREPLWKIGKNYIHGKFDLLILFMIFDLYSYVNRNGSWCWCWIECTRRTTAYFSSLRWTWFTSRDGCIE